MPTITNYLVRERNVFGAGCVGYPHLEEYKFRPEQSDETKLVFVRVVKAQAKKTTKKPAAKKKTAAEIELAMTQAEDAQDRLAAKRLLDEVKGDALDFETAPKPQFQPLPPLEVEKHLNRVEKYALHFAEEIDQWEKDLNLISDILEKWLECQRAWRYLEPIFNSPDIALQLP